MKKLLAAMVLSLIPVLVSAQQTVLNFFGPQTVTVKRNLQEYGPVALPANLTALTVTMSAEDWPRNQAVTVAIYASFDGGVTWPHGTMVTTTRPALEKDGSQSPVGMGIGWNEQIRQATHVKAITDNPGPGFTSTVQITGLTAF